MGIAILYPVLAQVVLTLALLLVTGVLRRRDILASKVTYDEIALDCSRWPAATRKWANCYSNQFELPVLFYVLCLIALATRSADLSMVLLAWLFVASRLIHAYIHTGSNIVIRRGAALLIGYIALVLMTAILLFRLLLPAS